MKWDITTENVLVKCIPDSGETEAVVPVGVRVIGNDAFSECKELKSVVLPEGVTEIQGNFWRGGAFKNCTALERVTLPSTLTHIGCNTFVKCTSLQEIIIPEGVTELFEGTFNGCTSLHTVQLPQGLKKIRCDNNSWNGTFDGCTALKHITLPEGLEEIGEAAFSGCHALEEIEIPKSVVSIGSSAFAFCSALNSITIPEGVTRIPSDAFTNCKSLNEIVLPESVTEIRGEAFNACSRLEHITLPKGLKHLGESAFRYCTSLKEITIPEGVETIENYTFQECKALADVSMSGVTYINWDAFKGCRVLKEIDLPESVRRISSGAFKNCISLRRISMPGVVSEMFGSEFEGCGMLEDILLSPMCSLQKDFLKEVGKGKLLHTCGDFVMSKDGRYLVECVSKNIEECVIPEGVTHIAEWAFRGCKRLKKVVFPASLTSIGANAFEYCALNEISLPQSVQLIGSGAFSENKELTEIEIPQSVRLIGRCAFWRCSKLKKVVIAEGVEEIHSEAFAYCDKLTQINIPSTLKVIGYSIFRENSKIPSHILPESIEYITAWGGKREFIANGKVDAELAKEGNISPLMRFLPQRTIAHLLIYQKGKMIEAEIKKGINENIEQIDFQGICACICEEIAASKGKTFNNATMFFVDYAEHIPVELIRQVIALLEQKKAKKNLETLNADAGVQAKLSDAGTTSSDENLHPMEAGLAERITSADCGSFVQVRQYARTLRQKGIIPDGLKYADGSDVSDNTFAFLLTACEKHGRCEQAREVVAEFDQNIWMTTLENMEQQKTYDKSEYLMKLLCVYGNGKIISGLIATYPRWNDWYNWNKVGKEMYYQFLWWICLSPTREALVFADKKNILARYAQEQGSTEEEMRSRLIADFGFDAQGIRIFHAGESEIEASLNPDASVRLFNRTTNKVIKSFPKKGTPNDGEIYAEWKKQLATVVKSRIKQIKTLFETGATQKYEQWRTSNCSNPIYAALARGVVWGVYRKNGLTDTFRLDEQLQEVDADGNTVKLTKTAQVGILHPVNCDRETLKAWQKAFAEIAQPIPQLETPVRLPDPKTLEARYIGCIVSPGTLLHGMNGEDCEGTVSGGNDTVQVSVFNRHDFYNSYPVEYVSVNEKRFADKRTYNTDIIQMDKLLNPFQKAKDAIQKGEFEMVQEMVKLQLIIPDNICDMLTCANEHERTEIALYLMNLTNEWGINEVDEDEWEL